MTDPSPLARALDERGLHGAAEAALRLGPTVDALRDLGPRLAVARERLSAAAGRDPETVHDLALGLATLVRTRDVHVATLLQGGLRPAQVAELADLRVGQLDPIRRRAEASDRARG